MLLMQFTPRPIPRAPSLLTLLLIILLLTLAPAFAFAQNVNESKKLKSYAPTSPYPATPNQWTTLFGRVQNDSPQPARILLTTKLDGQPSIQYASAVWLPPHSIRTFPQIVRTGKIADNALASRLTSALLTDAHPEQILSTDEGLIRSQSTPTVIAGFIDPEDASTWALLSTLRKNHSLPRSLTSLSANQFPPAALGFAGVTHLILATTPDLDSAQMQALRDWLVAGGKILILEDRVDPAFLARLLLDAWTLHRLDSVPVPHLLAAQNSAAPLIPLDPPAAFSRVLTAGNEQTLHSLDGFPTLLKKPLGLGEIYILTLDPRAWFTSDQRPTQPLEILASTFTVTTPRLETETRPLHALAESKIGYQIVSRNSVAFILASFIVALILAALFMHRLHRTAQASALAPLLALLTGLVLVLIGATVRSGIQPAVSSAAVITPAPQLHRELLSGVADIYAAQAQSQRLRMAQNTMLWPATPPPAGALLRLLWTDTLSAEWRNLPLPAGSVLRMNLAAAAPLHDSPLISARFTSRGLEGTLSLPSPTSANLDQLLLYSPLGWIRPSLTSSNTFLLADQPMNNPLSAASESAANPSNLLHIFTDNSLRQLRLASAESTLTAFALSQSQSTPPPLDLDDIRASQTALHRAARIINIPLTISPAQPRQPLSIPAALIALEVNRAFDRPKGIAPYDVLKSEWLTGLGNPAEFLIRFNSPRGKNEIILPIAAFPPNAEGRIDLILRISDVLGPDRTRTWGILHAELHAQGTVAPSPTNPNK